MSSPACQGEEIRTGGRGKREQKNNISGRISSKHKKLEPLTSGSNTSMRSCGKNRNSLQTELAIQRATCGT